MRRFQHLKRFIAVIVLVYQSSSKERELSIVLSNASKDAVAFLVEEFHCSKMQVENGSNLSSDDEFDICAMKLDAIAI